MLVLILRFAIFKGMTEGTMNLLLKQSLIRCHGKHGQSF